MQLPLAQHVPARISLWLALPLAGALMGCNPQSADITTGSFTAFLSINTSQVFVDDEIRVEDFDNSWIIDCRGLAEDDPNFNADAVDNCNDNGLGVAVEGAAGIQHEGWVNRDAFAAVHEELDPWRGEAIMTSEGDLQLTFHHRVPGGDFRFAFVVDPKFQPRVCTQDEAGNLALEPIDGDWVGQWSRSMTEPNYDGSDYTFPGASDAGTLFLLNSGGYQFNPDQTTSVWNLPEKMEAGYARARFGPEELFYQTPFYAMPRAYTAFDLNSQNGPAEQDLFLVDTDGLPPSQFQGDDFEAQVKADPDFIQMMRDQPERVSREINREIAGMYVGSGVDAPNYQPVVPSNAWRRPDDSDAGFDRWGELHYSWVRFDQPREQLAAGETVSGEFRLYFFGANSQSRVLVQGGFNVDKVRNDTWTTRDVRAEKQEEAGVELCGGIPD